MIVDCLIVWPNVFAVTALRLAMAGFGVQTEHITFMAGLT